MKQADRNWHEQVFLGLHYDLHATDKDTELGRELTAEHLRERLERIRPDWVQCDGKGHPGYASWPTRIGAASPGIVGDAMRVHRDVTRALGIRLGVHYSGVIDERVVALRPEWAVVDADGNPSARATCRLSPYAAELMVPQLIELIDEYDVDGFWMDGENWGSRPCWCGRCRAEFTRRTGRKEAPVAAGDPGWSEWLDLHRDLFLAYTRDYVAAVHGRKADCLVCSNWMYTVRQPEPMTVPVDYLSGDYTPNWGAARAAIEGRMLDHRGRTWDLMVWGFTGKYLMPNSTPVMKPALHLKQEVSEVLALGGALMIYTQPRRSGWLPGWQHDILAEVARFCRARQAACQGTESASEAAVLHVAEHYYAHNDPLYNYGEAIQPIEGALTALLETHHSTDLITSGGLDAVLDRYRLLVVPEQTRMGAGILEALGTWVERGGRLFLSGAHWAADAPDLVGCDPAGPVEEREAGLPVGAEAVPIWGAWQRVLPREGTVARINGVDGLEPDRPIPGDVLGTWRPRGKGGVLAIHGPVFRSYFIAHPPRERRLLRECFERLGVRWTVRLVGSPRVELVARRRGRRLLLNLVNRGAGEALAPNRVLVEELPSVPEVVLSVRMPEPPSSVRLLPEDAALPWSHVDGLLTVRVPEVRVHEIVAIDPA